MNGTARLPAIVKGRRSSIGPAAYTSVLLGLALLTLFAGRAPETQPSSPDPEGFASPLVLDLGKGLATDAAETTFDIDGDGRPDRLRDLGHEGGLLVFDADRDGTAGESGKELLGNAADIDGDGRPDGVSDGFEALASLALEASHRGWIADTVLCSGRLGPAELKALETGFGLRVRLGGLRGRDISLKEAGVTGLRLSTEPSRRRKNFDRAGNDISERDGAVFLRADGSAGPYADIWLRYRNALVPLSQLTSWR